MTSVTHFVTFLMSLVERLGYLGIFSVIGLEYACFPIPSEVVLPFVGMSIPQTSLQFLPTFLVSILAGLCGSWICYFIGLYGGQPLLTKFSSRSTSLTHAMNTFYNWFQRYGHLAVLFSRVIPLTRTYISLFAGVSHMSPVEFTLYSSTGIAAWNLLLIGLGFYVGNNWSLIENILNVYSNIIFTLIGIFIVIFILKKLLLSPKKAAK